MFVMLCYVMSIQLLFCSWYQIDMELYSCSRYVVSLCGSNLLVML